MRANQSHMMTIAKDLGLNFDKLQERHTCNTFDAHRLVKWAGDQGQQTAMKMALFEAYFGKGADVSDHEVLLQCVTALELDAAAAKQVLVGDQYRDAVRADEATYQRAGISSVPAFIINSKYLISGAQEAHTWVQALQEMTAA